MTANQIAKEEANRRGVELTDEEVDYILFELTAFPFVHEEEALRKEVNNALDELTGVIEVEGVVFQTF